MILGRRASYLNGEPPSLEISKRAKRRLVRYIAALQGFPHGHVPSPLKLTDHVGDSATATILSEILVLTKMNWNSADFAGLLPITLKFATLVGEIMKEVPRTQDPQPQFKYYM